MIWVLCQHCSSHTRYEDGKLSPVRRNKQIQISICSDHPLPGPVLLGSPGHSFSGTSQVGCSSILENLPQFFYRFSLPQGPLSPHVIPDWLHHDEIRSLWGQNHLLQDSWSFRSLKKALYGPGSVFGLVLVESRFRLRSCLLDLEVAVDWGVFFLLSIAVIFGDFPYVTGDPEDRGRFMLCRMFMVMDLTSRVNNALYIDPAKVHGYLQKFWDSTYFIDLVLISLN